MKKSVTLQNSVAAFIYKNKVLLAGMLSAVILVMQQAMQSGDMSFKTLGFAAFIAILSVIANTWRGQGLTLLGIFATLAGVAHNNLTTGKFTWNEFILSCMLSLSLAAASKLQSIGEVKAKEKTDEPDQPTA